MKNMKRMSMGKQYFAVDLDVKSGIVLNKLKVARILPLLKDGVREQASNYSPLSVLP